MNPHHPEGTIPSNNPGCACHATSQPQGLSLMASMPDARITASCCGKPEEIGQSSPTFEKPGYAILPSVDGFITTESGEIPRLKTRLSARDILSAICVRLNIGRDDYKMAPGLYAIGNPDSESPVVVTANYKLSIDHVRKSLHGRNLFILILNTQGVNVWCAAGKGTFGTDELVRQVKERGLINLVSHRKLVLPQLGAPGVSAVSVKRETGFQVIWGPIRASDLGKFLDSGMRADKEMRQVLFGVRERLILIPVELSMTVKPALIFLLILLMLSAIGPQTVSFKCAIERWPVSALSIFMGILSGAVLTPLFLPYLYGVSFSMKGVSAGLLTGLPLFMVWRNGEGLLGFLSLILITVALSSYLAMNFTGATPFTSPSGVEKEMRIAIPCQVMGALSGLILWTLAGYGI